MNELLKIISCSEAAFVELKRPLLENWVQKDKADFVQRLVLRMEKGLDLVSERIGRVIQITGRYV